MVKTKESPHLASDGSINLEAWLQHAQTQQIANQMPLIRHACVLAQIAGEHHPSLTGISCLQQGLMMAELLLELQVDAETIAASLVYSSAHSAELSLDDIRDHLGGPIAKLVQGTIQMDATRALPGLVHGNHAQLENVRKMLLAMVDDIRVVLIKLAERTVIMRTLHALDENTTRDLAKEAMEIYAPLANRLGLGQLKWELEDLAFACLEPKIYQEIAKFLAERRIDRENYIQNVITLLQKALNEAHITHFEISGRAKHIYSIYRKMQRKKLNYDQLFDLNAVRILVPNIEDCYAVLAIAHTLWKPITHEFDDYIATPKSNGYRSIHTAVIGPHGKNLEVQIRTHDMHRESEHGVAAHWRYKEGGQQKAGYEAKIAWLRQVLEWQRELAKSGLSSFNLAQGSYLDDRIYVFTPAGDIVDLPRNATPLDFAYHIHSEVGHRCRGAKVNGNIVPLTYTLNTGEQVEILTSRQPNPSRDWINPHLGYLKTARAKAKVHHWFKLQDFEKNAVEGHALFERECQKLALSISDDKEQLAQKLHYKSSKEMFAALGSGYLRITQIIGALQTQSEAEKKVELVEVPTVLRAPTKAVPSGITIAGVGDLLTHTARCCKPVPGDAIIGFITIGRGVAIHRKDCPNIINLNTHKYGRLIEVEWGNETRDIYPVDIHIHAYDRPGLVRDITTLIASERLNLIALTTTTNRRENTAHVTLVVEMDGLNSVSKLLDRIKHVPNVITVQRHTPGS